MRYLTPRQVPHESYLFLQRLAQSTPGAVVVCADDGEKFGAWPQTYDHVYANGWLRRFCDMLRANRSWIETTTLARAVDATLPRGKVYLPDASYREMTEWALAPERFREYQATLGDVAGLDARDRVRGFVRSGGFWRNFRARYPESDEMYCRMVGVSQRLGALESDPKVDGAVLARGREHLYRAQCNCAYWHGAFGGLYLPHLRNAVYHNLIAAHDALDAAEKISGPRVSAAVGDFNLDARQEVKLENDRLIAWVRPAQGGQIYELDDRRTRTNVLATLDRRPEAYHETIVQTLSGNACVANAPATATQQVLFKHVALDRMLVYDRHPRKAFVDHVYEADLGIGDLTACRDVERGDFACGAYQGQIETTPDFVTLHMERVGWALGQRIRASKTVSLYRGSGELVVRYRLDDLPRGQAFLWAVEVNIAAMAAPADDRYYAHESGGSLGPLDTVLDLEPCRGLELRDHWRDLTAALRWSEPASVWCYPVRSVSQSEGGFESVYQSSAVVPHWLVGGGRSEFELEMRLTLAPIAPARTVPVSRNRVAVEA
jgi:alpha-amylase